ncbi:hypothetical protein COCON_G00123240 [Conger conger]|uniref:Integrase catalytic domain-containing protein n=1 Tax=Conger conger TaxID=82655 RepID=A0A9Q1DH69_CONCO|nr:hypothetical protein COCON_G00123240 [Conger conger]
MVERVNRTIKEGIAKQIAQHQNKWTEALPTVLTILRATPSRATGLSPYELMTGRLMRLPIDPEVPSSDLGPLVLAKQQGVLEQLKERLKVLHAQAALKQQQADMRNDAQFNPTSEIKFTEGDMVMVSPVFKTMYPKTFVRCQVDGFWNGSVGVDVTLTFMNQGVVPSRDTVVDYLSAALSTGQSQLDVIPGSIIAR